MAARPWLDDYPLAFRGVQVRRSGERLMVCGGGLALPLAVVQEAGGWALLHTGEIAGAGLWDGITFTLCWAETGQGRWIA